MKRFLCLFFVCAVGISFIGSSFISCAPGIDELDSSPTDDERRRDRDTEDDDDDDDEGDECKGDEVCEGICKEIYDEYKETIECMEKGDVKVAKLEEVHDLLMKDFDSADQLEANLDEISEGDDVDRDDFGDYLEIGGTKWKEAIEAGLPGSGGAERTERLVVTLKWLVEDDNERAAKVLSSVNAGGAILKALITSLEKANRSAAICLRGENPDGGPAQATSINLWGLSSTTVTVKYVDGTVRDGEVVLDRSSDANLYNALSCTHSGIDNRNVFSYAAKENNETIFDMAFELLSEVCDVEDDSRDNIKEACGRILMCYTAWRDVNAGEIGVSRTRLPEDASSSFWGMVDEHSSALDVSGGSFDETTCAAEDFAEVF